MKSVAGKTVLVTGAAMGLGRLFATKAVADGAAHVVLWDVNESALKDTAAELEPDEVVDGSWKAMLKGTPFLVIPWTSRLNKVLSGVLPVRARDAWLRRVGVYNSMAQFTGRDPQA
jgi:NAD(P)-dependent dehydrogenase (short-subunit alcohol dehydrogenase family)